MVKYIGGKHEIVCNTDFYISKIIGNGSAYLFLINKVADGVYFPYEWHQMDLNCDFLDSIKGLENLDSASEYSNVRIIEYVENDEALYFNKQSDKYANYKWNKKTNSISKIDKIDKERKVKRSTDEIGNIIELHSFDGQETNFKIRMINGEQINYTPKYSFDNIRDMKVGSSIDELWIAGDDGLSRLDMTNSSYKKLLDDESLRGIHPINAEKLLVCTSAGNVYVVDRRNTSENGGILKIFDKANDNRFIKKNNEGEIIFDGSWMVYRLGEDMTVEKMIQQNSNWYAQLLDDNKLFISSSEKSNFITNMDSEVRDTNFLTQEIGRVLDCINLEENIIAISSFKGLSIFDSYGKKFIYRDSLRFNAMSLFLFDRKDLFVGYEDGTLRKYEYQSGSIELKGEWVINKGYGIAKIVHTGKNKLWISTFSGVCIFDMMSNDFYCLDKTKLSNPECNRYSGFYDSIYNKVYIGTIDGLNIIDKKMRIML